MVKAFQAVSNANVFGAKCFWYWSRFFLVREVCCGLFEQGKAGAVNSQVPLSVLPGECSVHSMAFSWPPPSPVLCALLVFPLPCLHCLG